MAAALHVIAHYIGVIITCSCAVSAGLALLTHRQGCQTLHSRLFCGSYILCMRCLWSASTDLLPGSALKLTSVGKAFTSSCCSGIMVSKIDQCMLDLVKFHGEGEDSESRDDGTVEQEPVATASATVTASSQSPKASDTERISAGNRLTSHRPQSPLSDSANSDDMSAPSQLSQSPALSETPPLAKPSSKTARSQVKSDDERYL